MGKPLSAFDHAGFEDHLQLSARMPRRQQLRSTGPSLSVVR
ncbi:hypothetical protein [Streptomyces sp. NPDC000983]